MADELDVVLSQLVHLQIIFCWFQTCMLVHVLQTPQLKTQIFGYILICYVPQWRKIIFGPVVDHLLLVDEDSLWFHWFSSIDELWLVVDCLELYPWLLAFLKYEYLFKETVFLIISGDSFCASTRQPQTVFFVLSQDFDAIKGRQTLNSSSLY